MARSLHLRCGWEPLTNQSGYAGEYVASGAASASPPVTLAYSHKHTFQSAALPVCQDIPFFAASGVALSFPVYVKQAQTGQTQTTRVQIIDPDQPWDSAASKLFDQAVSDSTAWQTITATYTPSADKQLILRVRGCNASGTMEWMYGAGFPAPTTSVTNVIINRNQIVR